jgi:2-oxoglutarate dehydrogenase complex dehydrogenase (E1) component-like enzyme
VCYPTTPAQYFHLLRRQARQETIRPLIVMTPKSLLRLPAASSTIDELESGGFKAVLDDARATDKAAVKRLVLCSGKVFYDLDATREENGAKNVAVIRLEQFYPFPKKALQDIFAEYPNATQVFWTQEEPQNMGGWTFVEPRLNEIKPVNATLRYVGRVVSASPATGSYAIHELEQRQIIEQALSTDSEEISPASVPEVSEKVAPASS